MIKKESIASDSRTEGAASCSPFERELLDHLKSLHQSLLEQNHRLAELLARNNASAQASEGDYLDRWEQRRRDNEQRLADELVAGPARFRVAHASDPERVVGATSGAEAIEKYRRHFGILRTNHEFSVAELAPAA